MTTKKHKEAIGIFEAFDYTCAYCNRQFSPEQPPLHLHHRVFKSQGGKDDIDNLASCCSKCHYEHGKLKGKKLISEPDNTKIDELTKRYTL